MFYDLKFNDFFIIMRFNGNNIKKNAKNIIVYKKY